MSISVPETGKIGSFENILQNLVNNLSEKIYDLCMNCKNHKKFYEYRNALKSRKYQFDYGSNMAGRHSDDKRRQPRMKMWCYILNTEKLDEFSVYTQEAIKSNLNGFLTSARKMIVGDLIKLDTSKTPLIYNTLCNYYAYKCIYRVIEGNHFTFTGKGHERKINDCKGIINTEYNMFLYKPLPNYTISSLPNLLELFIKNAEYTIPNESNIIVLPYKFK